jgi:phthalate 4,5-cis-dihydrodiol dehydrogenase
MVAQQEKVGTRRLNVGVIGVGVGGLEIIRAMVQQPETLNLMAGCDVVPVTLERFKERFKEARTYTDVNKLCEDKDLDAVYIASPNKFHAEHAITAARHGKHVMVEKPMAISLKETEQMVEECEKAGVQLVCAHTASYGIHYRTMRKIIQSGELGKLRAINILSYTDWILRPRSADELDFNQGGGVPYRQGPHQLDTVRLLGDGMLKSVRAQIGQWMPERPIPGYYNGHFMFEDGTVATAIHNGYGYFLLSEVNGPRPGRAGMEDLVKIRKALKSGTRDELGDKQDLRIGGAREAQQFAAAQASQDPGYREGEGGERAGDPNDRSGLNDTGDPGFLLVTCERGDMRVGREGTVWIYDDNGVRVVKGVSSVHSRGEIHEMYDAVVHGKPVFHSGRWGMGTAEAVFGMIESSQTGKEVQLTHQSRMHPDYDQDLKVELVATATR